MPPQACAICFVYPFIPSFHQVKSTISVDRSLPRLTLLTMSEITPRLIRISTGWPGHLDRPYGSMAFDCVIGTIRVGERNEGSDATVHAPRFPCSPIPLPASTSTFDLHHLATMSQKQLNFRVPDIKFRVSIVGRANAGKTSILQRVCGTTESPKIYRVTNDTRQEVCEIIQFPVYLSLSFD